MHTCVIIVGFAADFPQLPSIEQPAWGRQARAQHMLNRIFQRTRITIIMVNVQCAQSDTQGWMAEDEGAP